MKKDNKGFTLVELIVVLVILAILAAILVPSLLGYIDRSRDGQDMLDAKNMLTAVQARLSDAYAITEPINDKDHNSNSNKNADGDIVWLGKPIGDDILKLADANPYMCIVGIGKYSKYISTDPHKAYTAMFMIYWPEKDKEPIFFNGSEWMRDYPWESKSNEGVNKFNYKGEEVYLQFYFITRDTSRKIDNNWNDLKNALKANGKKVY